MKENNLNEKMDIKRLFLLYVKHIWVVLLATIAGIVVGALLYRSVVEHTVGDGKYVVESDYYITFNYNEYRNATDYFNAYTWDGILRTDPIVDTALEMLPDSINKDMILNSVTGEMRGDYRILTVVVKADTPENANLIADAYEKSLAEFPPKVDMLSTVEFWTKRAPYIDNIFSRTGNAMFLGGLLGFLFATFAYFIWYALNDSIYVETDFSKRYDIPFLGMITNKKSKRMLLELKSNCDYLLKGDSYQAVNVIWSETLENQSLPVLQKECPKIKGQISLKEDGFAKLRACDGAILLIPYGKVNGKLLEKVIMLLDKQDCKIAGVVVTDCDDRFLTAYYLNQKSVREL